jgi:Glucose-6-phosphate dehydrogenase, NAD binding domain/Glucose-6-phosphate dehydrogenase, C-terminal domain
MSSATNPAGQADALVLFGATGNLAHKQVFPALYAMVKRDALTAPVIGVAHSHADLGQLRGRVRDSIDQTPGGIDDEPALDRLLALLAYIDGDYNDPGTFTALKESLAGVRRPAFYLAIPPALFETVIEGLGRAGLTDGGRWAGVPWHLRSGKRLPATAVEVLVELKPPAAAALRRLHPAVGPANYLRFRLSPSEEPELAQRLLDLAPQVPTPVWAATNSAQARCGTRTRQSPGSSPVADRRRLDPSTSRRPRPGLARRDPHRAAAEGKGTLREHNCGHARPPPATRLRRTPSSCSAFVPAGSRPCPRFPPRRSMIERGSTVRVRQRA